MKITTFNNFYKNKIYVIFYHKYFYVIMKTEQDLQFMSFNKFLKSTLDN